MRFFFVASVLVLGSLAGGFALGTRVGKAAQSAALEAAAPAALRPFLVGERKADCALAAKLRPGAFVALPVANGQFLRVVSYDAKDGFLSASVLDHQHRRMTDRWQLDCGK